MIGALTNHLWQSTWFAAAAALLAVALRKNRAGIRYWLWLSASCKFLMPFSLLMSLGGQVKWSLPTRGFATASVSYTIVQISQPFSGTLPLPPATHGVNPWAILTIVVWACGFLCVASIRFRGWRRVRAAVRASDPMDTELPADVRSCPGLLEPGVVGLFRPVLLLPADIGQRLTPAQLAAVLAHEWCHVRRRDNLAAAAHMIVEAVFWFYPLVWWIGARLVDARERACDEEVLRLGNAPHEYAEGILSVCKSYVQPPLPCVTGVTGSDLKARIRTILAGCAAGELNRAKRIALAAAGIAALATPILVGVIGGPFVRAQWRPVMGQSWATITPVAPEAAAPPPPRPAETLAAPRSAYLTALGNVAANSVTVKPRIEGQLMTVTFKEGDLVQAGQVLASIDPEVYQFQLVEAEGQLFREQARLMEAARASPQDQSVMMQLRSAVEMAQANVQRAKLLMSYTQIEAPITGIIGLRQVDPGNMVHPNDANGLAVINQVQPISVVFSLPEDNLPQVLALLKQGTNVPVEAWSRDATVRYATGRPTAVDNQIDQNTGTVKLKAAFDNKDGELFPNQFVVVHLTLKKP